MISYGLQNLISLSKTELRSISADLVVPFGVGIPKVDLITSASDAIISKHDEAADKMLASIEEEKDENL